jgi:predicted DNA-binding transcriptional regulator
LASKDQTIGALILVLCVLGILIYGWLVFLTDWKVLILELTGFVAVGGILAIGAWIGWTMATTPPPKPIEELEKEIEAEPSEEKEAEAKVEAPEKKETEAGEKTQQT